MFDSKVPYQFPIKRRGRLFKTRPRRPGVCLGLGVYFLNAFFQYWKFIEPRTKLQQKRSKKCETTSSTLSHRSETGKLFIKKKNVTDRNSDCSLLNITFLRA